MLLRWLPWRLIIKKAAKAYGTVDPISLLAQLRRFSQPSEVQEPTELIRAGILFHARGLINTKAIQHNLDWVWPYWVHRQFNPADQSFIPRAFSFSHINLTHRNWTGLGTPNSDNYPLIDPRGLITPFFDSWSLDLWLLIPQGQMILPSREETCRQNLETGDSPRIITRLDREGICLKSETRVSTPKNGPNNLQIEVNTRAPIGSRLILAARPYNPEGIQFIEKLSYSPEEMKLLVDKDDALFFPKAPDRVLFSDYQQGDVFNRLQVESSEKSISCRVGMATAAAIFNLEEDKSRLNFQIPLKQNENMPEDNPGWADLNERSAKLVTPDKRLNYLFQTSAYSLLLFSARDFVPGPYTYKRFWFRDACLMLHALIKLGHTDRSQRIIEEFPDRQRKSGFFYSQSGEWDSNGQVLWIIAQWARITGKRLPRKILRSAVRGINWIKRKRLPVDDSPVSGLLPAGFSAEHFGPNDYYYWDDFWALGGLREIAPVLEQNGFKKEARKAKDLAEDLETCVNKSLESAMARLQQSIMPAAPLRRMDAGAIGSLAADYPLQLKPPEDRAVVNTLNYLQEKCFHAGAFFQDMIHSGQNPYLTLCIAQGLLRNTGSGHEPLIQKVAELASPTGTWPEAVHPLTGGGCMGDGHHGWAAAEWILMLRNMFVREEGNVLILGSGVFPQWFKSGQTFSFGPTPTAYGNITVCFEPAEKNWYLRIKSQKPILPDRYEIRVPGFKPEREEQTGTDIRIKLHRS